jgi:hypothetical protein
VFYNRVKGEMQLAVAALDYESVVIVQPSLLVGARAAVGQPRAPARNGRSPAAPSAEMGTAQRSAYSR